MNLLENTTNKDFKKSKTMKYDILTQVHQVDLKTPSEQRFNNILGKSLPEFTSYH